MRYIAVPSKRFKKAVRKYREGGRKHVLEALEEVIELLVVHDDRSLFVLSKRWRDHVLKGDKSGIRELHVSHDDLLLYSVDVDLGIIKLLDIVNHEDLRKQ